MAQRWHWLRLRTTCHPTESVDHVRKALQACTGLDDDVFTAALQETELDSHHGGKTVLLDVTLERSREVRACLSTVWTPEARTQLQQEIAARTDDHGVFHFRVSKQAAFAGRMETTRGDDAVQLRLKPEVHPASREGAMAALEGALSQ